MRSQSHRICGGIWTCLATGQAPGSRTTQLGFAHPDRDPHTSGDLRTPFSLASFVLSHLRFSMGKSLVLRHQLRRAPPPVFVDVVSEPTIAYRQILACATGAVMTNESAPTELPSSACYVLNFSLSIGPEWRNWQTQQTQNLPGITPRVGSTPSFYTAPFQFPWNTCEFRYLQGF